MSNVTAPLAGPLAAPIAAPINPTTLWLQIIPQSAIPMAFTSIATLLSSVLLGRWLTILTPKRTTEDTIIKMLHNEEYTEETHFLVDSMLAENEHYFKQMTYIRWSLVASFSAIFFFFLASLLNGLSVFQPAPAGVNTPLADSSRALIVIGMILLSVATILAVAELSEVLTPKIALDSARVEHYQERSSKLKRRNQEQSPPSTTPTAEEQLEELLDEERGDQRSSKKKKASKENSESEITPDNSSAEASDS